jgi:hypothetical protein
MHLVGAVSKPRDWEIAPTIVWSNLVSPKRP